MHTMTTNSFYFQWKLYATLSAILKFEYIFRHWLSTSFFFNTKLCISAVGDKSFLLCGGNFVYNKGKKKAKEITKNLFETLLSVLHACIVASSKEG